MFLSIYENVLKRYATAYTLHCTIQHTVHYTVYDVVHLGRNLMRHYLNLEDRVRIEMLIQMGENFSTIANQLGVSQSLIAIEIDRSVPDRLPNRLKKFQYNARQAQYLSGKRIIRSRRENAKYKLTKRRAAYIKKRILEDKWSPEQIVHATPNLGVGITTIYTWINRNKLPGVTNKNLRHKGKRLKRALSSRTWRSLRSTEADK